MQVDMINDEAPASLHTIQALTSPIQQGAMDT